jgi:hypothetical protein
VAAERGEERVSDAGLIEVGSYVSELAVVAFAPEGRVNGSDGLGLGSELVDGIHGLNLVTTRSQLPFFVDRSKQARLTFSGIVTQDPRAWGWAISVFQGLFGSWSVLVSTIPYLYFGSPLSGQRNSVNSSFSRPAKLS